jgi:hypothetical protein
MELVTRRDRGLFPAPGEISLDCSCPDWADMCKHVAAVLYGVGVRLDDQPALLFTLRGVDHADLIGGAAAGGAKLGAREPGSRRTIKSPDLGALFGIEIEAGAPAPAAAPPLSRRPRATPATPRRRSPR